MKIELQSTITCPACGHQATETMSTDACQYMYDCKPCGAHGQPRHGWHPATLLVPVRQADCA